MMISFLASEVELLSDDDSNLKFGDDALSR